MITKPAATSIATIVPQAVPSDCPSRCVKTPYISNAIPAAAKKISAMAGIITGNVVVIMVLFPGVF
jgi:hypothetical protein